MRIADRGRHKVHTCRRLLCRSCNAKGSQKAVLQHAGATVTAIKLHEVKRKLIAAIEEALEGLVAA